MVTKVLPRDSLALVWVQSVEQTPKFSVIRHGPHKVVIVSVVDMILVNFLELFEVYISLRLYTITINEAFSCQALSLHCRCLIDLFGDFLAKVIDQVLHARVVVLDADGSSYLLTDLSLAEELIIRHCTLFYTNFLTWLH